MMRRLFALAALALLPALASVTVPFASIIEALVTLEKSIFPPLSEDPEKLEIGRAHV